MSPQYKAYKVFVLKKHMNYETKQKGDINKINDRLERKKSKLATLSNIKKSKKNKNRKKHQNVGERERISLE